MTGKATVPVVKQSDGTFKANFMNREFVLRTSKELEDFKEKVDVAGFYYHCADEKTIQAIMSDEKEQTALFMDKMTARIEEWLKFADERLAGANIKCYVCPGNDDAFEIDEIINKSRYVTNAEGKAVHINDDNEMISSGWSTPTPWNTPREISDEELSEKIESLASQIDDMKNCIFAFHDPPRDTSLDIAQAIDKDLKATMGDTMHVGSSSVRDAIMKYQPLLGLHGHIHESRGFCTLGRTLCTNPGSIYGAGILQSSLIILDKNKVKEYASLTG